VTVYSYISPKHTSLIIYSDVEIKTLTELGKQYPWEKPDRCPVCMGIKLWGHGFVERYFDESDKPVLCKRWRCILCGAVHTMRPATYYRFFQVSIKVILEALEQKIANNCFPSHISRRQRRYWWKGFLRQASYLTNVFGNYTAALKELLMAGIIPITHSLKYREIPVCLHAPYLNCAIPP